MSLAVKLLTSAKGMMTLILNLQCLQVQSCVWKGKTLSSQLSNCTLSLANYRRTHVLTFSIPRRSGWWGQCWPWCWWHGGAFPGLRVSSLQRRRQVAPTPPRAHLLCMVVMPGQVSSRPGAYSQNYFCTEVYWRELTFFWVLKFCVFELLIFSLILGVFWT